MQTAGVQAQTLLIWHSMPEADGVARYMAETAFGSLPGQRIVHRMCLCFVTAELAGGHVQQA